MRLWGIFSYHLDISCWVVYKREVFVSDLKSKASANIIDIWCSKLKIQIIPCWHKNILRLF